MTEKASEMQVGGNHYKDMPIEPSYFCQVNKLGWCESNAIKYACRHNNKNGRQDIEKAIHYLQLLLEWEYPTISAKRYEKIHTGLTAAEVAAITRPCSACMDEHKCGGGLRQANGDCLHHRLKDVKCCESCSATKHCTREMLYGHVCSLWPGGFPDQQHPRKEG